MKKGLLITLLVIVGLVVIFGILTWKYKNQFVTADQAIQTQWGKVETQYQRRFDLIPNLVNSVKGAMAQEKDVFGAIADARTKYAGAKTTDEKAAAASQLETSFGRLLVIMENYPQLKSIEAVQTLMIQLEGTENRISVERTRYNDEVQVYNLLVNKIPSAIFAGMMGYKDKEFFKSVTGAESAPEVKF